MGNKETNKEEKKDDNEKRDMEGRVIIQGEIKRKREE